MSTIKLKLVKNLRRNVLQGNPWIYKDALSPVDYRGPATLARLYDQKNDPLAWAIYDPSNPIAARVLSLDNKPPNKDKFYQLFHGAWTLRKPLLNSATNCFRLFNGEGDLLPGLVCDIYNDTAVIQFDGQGPEEFWELNMISDWILQQGIASKSFHKARGIKSESAESILVEVIENGIRYFVDISTGQKTGFFLDQRENRNYVKQSSRAKSFANIFSYTGGFSLAAGLGGAKHVTSVDISPKALAIAQKNWELNNLPPNEHKCEVTDATTFLRESTQLWEAVLIDPPSMAPSEKLKTSAMQKYIEIFALGAKRVSSGGDLYISSCSSHISFENFNEIIHEALSNARRRGQILKISGQGPDHPYPHALPHFRYLKFAHIVLD